MNWKFPALAAIAVLAGAFSALLLCQSVAFRGTLAHFCGKGPLLALAGGEGIYQTDLDRVLEGVRFRRGREDEDVKDRRSIVTELARDALAARLASGEEISSGEVERELKLLQFQFRDRSSFEAALKMSGLSEHALRQILSKDLRARRWLNRQVGGEEQARAEECARFYGAHQPDFLLPMRVRVSHLFLAAPPETPPDVVDLKKEKIEELAGRLQAGENFADLVAAESEDEASKVRGGDLGFFSASRVPEDFFAVVQGIPPNQPTGPVQTRLGFHLLQVVETKPAEQLPLEQAGEEIRAILAWPKRQAALRKLEADLASQIRLAGAISQDGF